MARACEDGRHFWAGNRCACGEKTRCCAVFARSGRRCTRSTDGATYCKRHAWVEKAVEDANRRALDALRRHVDDRDVPE